LDLDEKLMIILKEFWKNEINQMLNISSKTQLSKVVMNEVIIQNLKKRMKLVLLILIGYASKNTNL